MSTEKISFCINTSRNEINHVKLLFRSLEQNLSTKEHEIVVFIDSDNQGTFEWLLTQKSIFPNLKILRNTLPICYGYSRNINEMFEQASNEIVSFLQSDMVVCKDYDLEILKGLEPGMMLCSTRIEPPLHPPGPEKITHDFGLDPETFDLETFTHFAEKHKEDRFSVYFFAPFTMYRKEWLSVGGQNTIFRRSREDSDMLIRMVLNGTKISQTWRALAYHFTCTSSRGPKWFDPSNREAQERLRYQKLADMYELHRFIALWGAFKHGDLVGDAFQKQVYYNVAAKIDTTGASLEDFLEFERFFDKVYVEDTSLIPQTQRVYDNQHKAANLLLNISDDVWEEYKYMYNTLDASTRIKPLSELQEESVDVLIEFKLKDVDDSYIDNFLGQLQDILDDTDEIGKFSYGPFIFHINNKIDRAKEKAVITNPEIKPEHLYEVY